MEFKAMVLWLAAAAGIIFAFWQLWLFAMWSMEKKFFYRGVDHFREGRTKGLDPENPVEKKSD